MKRRLSALPVACGLLLAAQVATARAEAPQRPVTPTVPTGAVQVGIGVPNVAVDAQGGSDRYERMETRGAGRPEEHVTDNRLVLQLGVLGAFLYLACLAGWFCATRLRRTRA